VGGITHHHLDPGAPTADFASTEILVRTAALAAEVARRERPALIHANSGHRGYELALVGLALREHLRIPLVYEVRGFLETVWTADMELAETAEESRRRYDTEARTMTAADAITTLSVSMRDEIVSRGIPTDRIVIVPNGIDPDAFRPTPPDPELRRRYGLGDRWVFGYVSGMDHPREQQDLLIEATGRLVRAGRSVVCLLVGDGSRTAALEAQVAAAGLGDVVVFTGHVPHEAVPAHYALFDAFVVPRAPDRAARFVTPLKPFEAMAMGRPVVVSDLPALVEIVAPDERGLAFRTGDAAALVAVLERLMDHPELADAIATAGRDWVLAERTWAANGPRYRDLYAAVRDRFSADHPAAAG
jgi:glycosyltransferase involved in cell wall biosynthesis